MCVKCGLQANPKWLQATASLLQCALHALSKAQRSAKLALLPSRKGLWILGMLPCPVLLLLPCSKPVPERHLPPGQHCANDAVAPFAPSLPPMTCCLVRWHAARALPEHCCCQIRLGPLTCPCAAIQHAQTGLQLQQIHHGVPCPLVPPAPLASPSGPQHPRQGAWPAEDATILQHRNMQAGLLGRPSTQHQGSPCSAKVQCARCERAQRPEHGVHCEPWGVSLTSGQRGGSWGPAGRGGTRARAASCSAWSPSPPSS